MTPNMMNYISGSVKIKISGNVPEKFINLCITNNIFLWGIVKNNDGFFACMRLDDFFCIRPLVRQSHNRIEVIGYNGLPFIMKKIKRRKMLIVGAVLFIFLLNIMLSYIWFVDIIGLKNISSLQIQSIVASNGLRPGIKKDVIDTKFIENQIALAIPEVAWVGIKFTGTRAIVEIVEKTIPKQEEKCPANIVATKDGIITEIIALAGQNVVKKGNTVKKGDLVIKGVAYEGAAVNEVETTMPEKFIRAKGIVKARVWYESYGETGLIKNITVRTGRQQIGVTLKVGPYEFVVKKPYINDEEKYEIDVVHKKLAWWRNSNFTVESIISTYYDVDIDEKELTFEEARDEAVNIALTKMQGLITESAQVLSRNIEVLKTSDENLVRVKVSIETIEDIGQYINIP